ncbi:MAG: HEPN family nuclease [Rikenellaceae bacterium]|nr:HEPN family nuclease [Rikenellaceae bacterium]
MCKDDITKDSRLFIQRTLQALEQYEKNLPPNEQSYDRTLFINACVGLLMVPRADFYEKLPSKSIENWDIAADKFQMDERKTIRNVVRHLRNAIAHNRFNFDSGDEHSSVVLDNITFTDAAKKVEEVENFRATLDFETFKILVKKVAQAALQEE